MPPLFRIRIGVSIIRPAALRVLVLRTFCKHNILYVREQPLQLCLLFEKLVPLRYACRELVGLIADRAESVAERLSFRALVIETEVIIALSWKLQDARRGAAGCPLRTRSSLNGIAAGYKIN